MKSLILVCLLFSAIYSNAQQVSFDPNVYIQATTNLELVATGDVNGDGRTDIVGVGTLAGREIYVWLQDNNGKLQSPIITSILAAGTCLTVSDIDNDNICEILIGVGRNVKIYGLHGSTLILEDDLITAQDYVRGIAIGDFDSDNLADIGIAGAGKYVTVIYQQGESQAKWQIKQYPITSNGYWNVSSGRFGTITKDVLIYLYSSKQDVTVMSFTSNRMLDNNYDLEPKNDRRRINDATIVKKGAGKPNELWVSVLSNSPYSQVSVWRDLQTLPDTVFKVHDIAASIQSSNLDCDEDDEVVIVHPGWQSITTVADTQKRYRIPYVQNQRADCLSLGDINGDGKIDIVTIDRQIGLIILTNITSPCWPTELHKIESTTKGLLIYPNPANDDVTITADIPGTLVITDLRGKSIYHSEFAGKASINMQQWPSGIYMATLRNAQYSTTQKLVKY